MRLISRIANRNYGLKEANLIRLVQAFVVSRIIYVTPYLNLQVAEKAKIERIIRGAYKQALGLPTCTANERLLALGIHNTLEELIEAHTVAQYERLTHSPTGRHILYSLGINYAAQQGTKVDIPQEIRECAKILPLPRNMHPEHNEGRRQERAKAIKKRFQNSRDVIYVDAAEYATCDAMSMTAVDCEGKLTCCGTVVTAKSETAEECAIALAIASTTAKYIISDSKTAVRNFIKGRISPEARRILLNFRDQRKVQILWAPAHSSLPGNEAAHNTARGLACRATEQPPLRSGRDRMVSYREITNHYRFERARYPPAHPSLNKRQSVVWRLLQTNTYPNPVAYSHYYPGQYSGMCALCKDRADLSHILWACPQATQEGRKIANDEQWETVLLSSDPKDQLWAVQLAENAARAQGLLAAV